MNVELLEAVRHTILSAPERFCAAQWAYARNVERVLREGMPPEEFRCCIAGHVLLRGTDVDERQLLHRGGFHTGGQLWEQAASTLEIGEERGQKLFFPTQWDPPYKQRYYLCDRTQEADIAASYLEYFLHNYGESASPPRVRSDRTPAPARSKPRPKRARRAPAAL